MLERGDRPAVVQQQLDPWPSPARSLDEDRRVRSARRALEIVRVPRIGDGMLAHRPIGAADARCHRLDDDRIAEAGWPRRGWPRPTMRPPSRVPGCRASGPRSTVARLSLTTQGGGWIGGRDLAARGQIGESVHQGQDHLVGDRDDRARSHGCARPGPAARRSLQGRPTAMDSAPWPPRSASASLRSGWPRSAATTW